MLHFGNNIRVLVISLALSPSYFQTNKNRGYTELLMEKPLFANGENLIMCYSGSRPISDLDYESVLDIDEITDNNF